MINDSTQYIARISYGKDSLKMLEVIKSRGLPLDRITTTDVWATDTISANLPPMAAFKDRMDQRIWDMYRIEVEHLCALNKDGSKKTYEQMFYHIPVRRSQTGNVERERERAWSPKRLSDSGEHHRIPSKHWVQLVPEAQTIQPGERSRDGHSATRQCDGGKNSKHGYQRISNNMDSLVPGELKMHLRQVPFSSERTTRRRDRNIVEYLGIAADEPARFGQLNARKRAPLVEFDIDEGLCGLYCQYNDMLAPTYETSCRDGCWFCHNQGVDQLRLLRRNYPELWAILMRWDLESPVSFKADGHTVHDFDRRFQMEDERKVPMGRSFRWAMLENPPKFLGWESEQISFL